MIFDLRRAINSNVICFLSYQFIFSLFQITIIYEFFNLKIRIFLFNSNYFRN